MKGPFLATMEVPGPFGIPYKQLDLSTMDLRRGMATGQKIDKPEFPPVTGATRGLGVQGVSLRPASTPASHPAEK